MKRILTILGIVLAAALFIVAGIVAVQARSTGSEADELEAKNAKTAAEITKMEQDLVVAHNREDTLKRFQSKAPENVAKFDDFSARFEQAADHDFVDAAVAYVDGDSGALERLQKAVADARFDAEKQGEALEEAKSS